MSNIESDSAKENAITHREMALWHWHYRTMIGWQNVPEDELREQMTRANDE